ncbi:MAG: UbiA family prenyltransferase [Cyanobacteria bacterium J06600_6]
MSTPEDRDREFNLREAELPAKERELRLRELETEIYQSQKTSEPEIASPEAPLYETRRHDPPPSSIQKFGRKIVKYAKFAGFVVAGIAIIKVGFFVGMWITYLLMAGIIAGIGYQIFLKEDS